VTLQELAKTFESQLQTGPFVTIDDSVLGSSGVDELLRSQLGLVSGRLEVSIPLRKVSYPGAGPLVLTGSASFLGLPATQEVTLTFLEGEGIVFDLTATLSSGWDFGTSFPDLHNSLLEGLLVSGGSSPRAQLVFATFVERGVPAAPNQFAVVGLNFNGTVGLSGNFDLLLDLLRAQAEVEGEQEAVLPG